MKIISIGLILLNSVIALYGQNIKSANYDNSFIKFHEYGQGEPIIILGGGPGNDCHQEEDVALKLSVKYKAILLEQRGSGMSMPPKLDETTINFEFAKLDLPFLLDSLKINKAII